MMLEENKRYDPYTDKFIKNTTTGTTTDRIEIGTDGNLYELSISNSISNSSGLHAKSLEELDKCDYIDRSRKSYTKDKVIAMFEELKTEIVKIAEEEKYHDAKWALGLKYSTKIIQQKIDKLKGA